MNTPMKLAKTMKKCARVLRQGSSQLISPRSLTWSAANVKPKSSMTFNPSSTSNLCANSSAVLVAKETSISVDQRRFYNDRNDWREKNLRREYQPGMNATYKMPNMDDGESRYDQIYMGKKTAPVFEGNVEHEGFDPRYNEYHFKRQAHDGRERRKVNGKRPYDYVFGNYELIRQDTDSRRRISQDPWEHQLRQERIIEENKRKWQYRAEPKREIHAHGTTYKTDKVYGADRNTPWANRVVKARQAAEEYSRRRRAVRENELRRLADDLRQSRKSINLPGNKTRRSQTEVRRRKSDTKETSSRLKMQNERESESYWHSWNTCPDERQVIETAQHVTDRGLGYSAQRPNRYHPYDVTRRSLHQHKIAKEDVEIPMEYQYNLRAKTVVRPKQINQVKRDYLLNLMQQDEEIQSMEDNHEDNSDDYFEMCPPIHRRLKPSTQSQVEIEETPLVEPDTEELIMHRPVPRISKYKIPIKAKANLPSVYQELKMKPEARSIEPPRFQMSIKSKVVRNRAPVSSFSETITGKLSKGNRNFTRSTSAHLVKAAHF